MNIGTRAFRIEDQAAFADASGDHNPIHVDPIAARRLLFGTPVVHGVHLVAWALNRHLAQGGTPPSSCIIRFRQPVFLDEDVVLERNERDGSVALTMTVDGGPVADIVVSSGGKEPRLLSGLDGLPSTSPGAPRSWASDDLEHARGRLAVRSDARFRGQRLPELCQALGDAAVDQLLALSRLVGMECPGDRSLFSGLEISFDTPHADPEAALSWEVRRFHAGLGAIRIAVSSTCLTGSVSAFVRPATIEQPRSSDIRQLVDPNEFSDTHWVVVGGSRGLGEVAVKLLAAGGARVTFTWHRGRDDAERVAAEVLRAGGTAVPIQLRIEAGRVLEMDGLRKDCRSRSTASSTSPVRGSVVAGSGASIAGASIASWMRTSTGSSIWYSISRSMTACRR